MRFLLFFLFVSVVDLSCKKDNASVDNLNGSVEIYLLKSFQIVPGKCKIDTATAVLEDAALIKNENIISYSQTNYQFQLSDTSIQKIKALRDFTPFAVTVEKQVIYFGFFKPSISSSSCDHSITMDQDWGSRNKIAVKLGYPGQVQNINIDDQRNNPKLLLALSIQGKLN